MNRCPRHDTETAKMIIFRVWICVCVCARASVCMGTRELWIFNKCVNVRIIWYSVGRTVYSCSCMNWLVPVVIRFAEGITNEFALRVGTKSLIIQIWLNIRFVLKHSHKAHYSPANGCTATVLLARIGRCDAGWATHIELISTNEMDMCWCATKHCEIRNYINSGRHVCRTFFTVCSHIFDAIGWRMFEHRNRSIQCHNFVAIWKLEFLLHLRPSALKRMQIFIFGRTKSQQMEVSPFHSFSNLSTDFLAQRNETLFNMNFTISFPFIPFSFRNQWKSPALSTRYSFICFDFPSRAILAHIYLAVILLILILPWDFLIGCKHASAESYV